MLRLILNLQNPESLEEIDTESVWGENIERNGSNIRGNQGWRRVNKGGNHWHNQCPNVKRIGFHKTGFSGTRNKAPSVCAFVVGDATSPKRVKSRTVSADEASSSGGNQRSPDGMNGL
nr:uncharacterized protein LOC109187764 [Ipomoea trifida]